MPRTCIVRCELNYNNQLGTAYLVIRHTQSRDGIIVIDLVNRQLANGEWHWVPNEHQVFGPYIYLFEPIDDRGLYNLSSHEADNGHVEMIRAVLSCNLHWLVRNAPYRSTNRFVPVQ